MHLQYEDGCNDHDNECNGSQYNSQLVLFEEILDLINPLRIRVHENVLAPNDLGLARWARGTEAILIKAGVAEIRPVYDGINLISSSINCCALQALSEVRVGAFCIWDEARHCVALHLVEEHGRLLVGILDLESPSAARDLVSPHERIA